MGLLPINHGDSDSNPVDAMFKAFIGHSVRESKHLHRMRRDRVKMLNESAHLAAHLLNNGSIDLKTDTKNDTTTTENPIRMIMTLAPNETDRVPYTKSDFLQRRKLRQLEEILRTPSVVKQFLNDDDFDTMTRRFDNIKTEQTRRKKELLYYVNPPRKPGMSFEERKIKKRQQMDYWVKQSFKWNYDYPYFMNGYKYTLEKNKTTQIMHAIVHEIRYKLVYPQLLRKKYHKSIRYRLGYLFGMLRHLQRQARLVYHEFQNMVENYQSIYFTLRIMDKINRFSTDVKDVIKLIRVYELQRKTVEDPHYYDQFPSSVVPKWRRAIAKKIKDRNLTMKDIRKLKKKEVELQKLRIQI